MTFHSLDCMTLATSVDQLTQDLTDAQQRSLHHGDVVLTGDSGRYGVWAIASAPLSVAWQVLTAYEEFPEFLPSVVASRILERDGERVVVERRDRRKVGWMPIKVRIVTENIEVNTTRIDYRMVEGTLESMEGQWRLAPAETTPGTSPATLVVQTITAKANLGPLQGYFYEVFEQGLTETLKHLCQEMAHRA